MAIDLADLMEKDAVTPGNDDTTFEEAFANLAHATIRDRAPRLLDHEVGFQLLDRTEQGDKAVGVVAFRVGSDWIYAPMFFLNGDLKGRELLYMKNQDMFVPLSEAWLNYLITRKPRSLGGSVGRSVSQLGVRQPDLSVLSRSPLKQAAAHDVGSLDEAMPDPLPPLATVLCRLPVHLQSDRWPSLEQFMKRADFRYARVLAAELKRNIPLAQALNGYYGIAKVAGWVREAAKRPISVLNRPDKAPSSLRGVYEPDHPIKTGALQILTPNSTKSEMLRGLSQADRERLLSQNVLIRDRRSGDELSVPYRVKTDTELTNPRATGIYKVLMGPGKFERCLVVMSPHGPEQRHSFCTLVRIEGRRTWRNIHPSRVWVASNANFEEYDRWFKRLPQAKSLTGYGRRAILLGPTGNATVPIRTTEQRDSGRGVQSYDMEASDWCDYDYAEPLYASAPRPDTPFNRSHDTRRVLHLNSIEGPRIRSYSGEIHVPKDYRVLYVEQAKKPPGSPESLGCWSPESEDAPFLPGTLLDAHMDLIMKTAAMTLTHDGLYYSVNGNKLEKTAAVVALVREHGFSEATAEKLLKDAETNKKLDLRVRYAPWTKKALRLTDEPTGSPGFPDLDDRGNDSFFGSSALYQSQSPQDAALPVEPDMSSQDTRDLYNPNPQFDDTPMDHASVQAGIQSGQREVLDTAILSQLLKTVRDDSMVDRHMPQLMAAVDRLGRLIFSFYWNQDRFADRYGKADLTEIEDALRNMFEGLGDLVLTLKQKEVDPFKSQVDLDQGLRETAAM